MDLPEVEAYIRSHPGYLSKGDGVVSTRFGIPVDDARAIKKKILGERKSGESITEANDLPRIFKPRRAWQLPSGEMRFSFEASYEEPEEERGVFREALLCDIREEMQGLAVPGAPRLFSDSGNLAVFHFCDLHLGKDAWTLEEAEKKIRNAYEFALGEARLRQAERVHLVIGHDLLQIDREHVSRSGTLHTTTSGTPVTRSNDSWRTLYRSGRRLVSWMVRRSLQEGFPITVDFIPGNHSEQSEITMADAVGAQFEGVDGVQVRMPEDGEYELAFQWGRVGFMETHGHTIPFDQLPLHFANRFPSVYCHSTFRQVITGHKHFSKKRRVGDWTEEYGCNIYISPSLSPQDAWHRKFGYDGVPGFDIFCYNREDGPIGHTQAHFAKVAQ